MKKLLACMLLAMASTSLAAATLKAEAKFFPVPFMSKGIADPVIITNNLNKIFNVFINVSPNSTAGIFVKNCINYDKEKVTQLKPGESTICNIGGVGTEKTLTIYSDTEGTSAKGMYQVE